MTLLKRDAKFKSLKRVAAPTRLFAFVYTRLPNYTPASKPTNTVTWCSVCTLLEKGEVGALTFSPSGPSPVASEFSNSNTKLISNANSNANNEKTLGAKKNSGMLLALGLPSTMRLSSSLVGPTVSGLAPSPIITSISNVNLNNADAIAIADSKLSIESTFYATHQPSSVLSSGSSLRPLSTMSTNSRIFFVCEFGQLGTFGVGSDIRWDEQGLETVREMRRLEKEDRDGDQDIESEKKERRAQEKEDTRAKDGGGRR
ncbi:hypothetical protein CVT25_005274 [Psilocybe cyanescens]|uniref:Uncharacterized protein n=1 Tax=Psilocybe cyanescens TaxID=93625 RepID=A0A409XDV2_PSICY|nr:hypothetical protein CVT25_005274 [Psilocybe cyanescens]